MTSNNGTTSSEAEMNKWAKTVFWFGIGSLLPYLLLGIVSYSEKNLDQLFLFRVENDLLALCVFWGIIFGFVPLMSGIVAIKHIHGRKNTEKGIPSAILGTVLGLFAIVSNIVTIFIIYVTG